MKGTIEAIHVRPAPGQPVRAQSEVEAVAGRGLLGNHDAQVENQPKKQATLIEAEALEAIVGESGIQLEPGASRRNLTTRGVALNHLVGREFRIGEVRLRGLELCEPCNHLQKLTVTGIVKALLHRGGLRAELLSSGTIRRGDVVETVD